MRQFKTIIGSLVLVWLALVFQPVQALASGSLIDSEVDVDVTGTDTANAREQALAKGQAEALEDLLSKFTTGDQAHQIVVDMDPNKISAMSRGTEVLSEKMASNRYRATLKISFDADEITKLVDNSGSNNAATAQAPKVGSFLIIPSYEEEGTVMLWDDGNPWRNAWKITGIESPTGDIIVPYGDNADKSVVDEKTLSSVNYAALQPMIVRYGVTDIILLHAKFTQGSEPTLEVVKRRVNRTQNEVNVFTYRADPQENRDSLMARATHDIVDSLEHKKNEEAETTKTVYGGDHATIMLLASISTLSSWTQLRTKLSALPMIDKLEPLAISPQQVDILVHYRGAPDSLANAITAQNIRLVQNPTYWVISRD